ncbi:hypothetical protein [Martelella sp. AMO21009]
MDTSELVSFLSSSRAFPADTVQVKETHTAFVFLAGNRALKMKKPIRLAYLDFSTLEKRRAICLEELRVNRQMAGDVYQRVIPVTREADGGLVIDGKGGAVEWLVEMKRLPDRDMLDRRLARRNVTAAEIATLGRHLCTFYRKQPRRPDAGDIYIRHLSREMTTNRLHLLAVKSDLDLRIPHSLLQRIEERFDSKVEEIFRRSTAGLIVDGHGDLRTEHVCLTSPPVFFDRLEFDARMRQIDVYDEVNYLGLECEMAGHGWIGRDLRLLVNEHFAPAPSVGLCQFYSLFRLFLRARLAIDHLRDEPPVTPEKWIAQTKVLLARAEEIGGNLL